MTAQTKKPGAPGADSAPGPAADDRPRSAANRVISVEVAGLEALKRSLNDNFDRAIERLAAISGRVIVTGMGKSGHVGRKIAATLASTGTPAYFVHPAEASHGDLGMITSGDALLALSNSGTTPELNDLVDFVKRFAIPLIAITRRPGSALAEAADIALDLPDSAEACPMGLAPTTSTTMMMALGDAIAIALLERRGFTAADFHIFHPGGQLGRKLLHIADIMHEGDEMPLVGSGTRMADAILVMTAKSFGCVGITGGDGRLIGIITDGDLRRHMSPQLMEATVNSVMTSAPRTVARQMLAGEALGIMNGLGNQRRITSLFVVERGRPIGIVSIHDLLRAGVV
ncbi:MAG: KpsF/GutQ family sugar-phosphate isomerase [Alphaproteobacteria bacterium]|nr:KpsF/GutQ family sugar-phosphate isomerase [Alphaproteobacteria bacterium]